MPVNDNDLFIHLYNNKEGKEKLLKYIDDTLNTLEEDKAKLKTIPDDIEYNFIQEGNRKLAMAEVDVRGDGNCLIRSVYASLKSNYNYKFEKMGISSWKELKKKIINEHINSKESRKIYEDFKPGRQVEEYRKRGLTDFFKYIEHIKNNDNGAFWWGEFEINHGIVPFLREINAPFNIYEREREKEYDKIKTENENCLEFPVNVVYLPNHGPHYREFIDKNSVKKIKEEHDSISKYIGYFNDLKSFVNEKNSNKAKEIYSKLKINEKYNKLVFDIAKINISLRNKIKDLSVDEMEKNRLKIKKLKIEAHTLKLINDIGNNSEYSKSLEFKIELLNELENNMESILDNAKPKPKPKPKAKPKAKAKANPNPNPNIPLPPLESNVKIVPPLNKRLRKIADKNKSNEKEDFTEQTFNELVVEKIAKDFIKMKQDDYATKAQKDKKTVNKKNITPKQQNDNKKIKKSLLSEYSMENGILKNNNTKESLLKIDTESNDKSVEEQPPRAVFRVMTNITSVADNTEPHANEAAARAVIADGVSKTIRNFKNMENAEIIIGDCDIGVALTLFKDLRESGINKNIKIADKVINSAIRDNKTNLLNKYYELNPDAKRKKKKNSSLKY